MRTTFAKSLLCAVLAFASAPLALADGSVRKAQDLVDDAEYTEAAKVLRQALARGGLSKSELVELYRLQGTVNIALGRRERAEAAFRNLITAEPAFALPNGTSPKVREVFDAVHDEMLKGGGLDEVFRPQHIPVGTVAPSKDVTLHLEIGASERAAQIAKVQAFYRRLGTTHFSSVFANQAAGGGYDATIPGFVLDAELDDYAIEYYIEATDAQENRLTGVGKPSFPLVFEVLGTRADDAVADGQPAGNTLWITLGVAAGAVVVIGALVGVGAYFLLTQKGTGSATITVTY
ncbi:MAG: hypothetical protein JXR83_04520 [Deltaproteobacteria bacterium]|nr:hypothetical protein [Deltaproteobacteria bacterium]